MPCTLPAQPNVQSRRAAMALVPQQPGGIVDDLTVACALDDALSLAHRRLGRPLEVDLNHLESLQALALSAPEAWRRAVAPRREEAALWLYTVAVGVGAMGLPDHAVALLDVLPDVPGGARGRRGLLCTMLASSRPATAAGRAS